MPTTLADQSETGSWPFELQELVEYHDAGGTHLGHVQEVDGTEVTIRALNGMTVVRHRWRVRRLAGRAA